MSRRTWIGLLVPLVTIFLLTTGWMVVRHQNAELWGRVPLVQLSSGWLSILLLIGRKALRNPTTFKVYLLGTFTALLLGLGFPPWPLTILLFVGFVPLLQALDLSKDMSRKQRLLLVYHTLLLWNIFSTYWVANSSAYAAGLFANIVNAMVMLLPIFAYQYVRKKLGERVALVAFVSSWIAFEFLHMHWDLYWPWLTLGNGLAKIHWAIQWYDVTGVFGGSALILTINFLVYRMIRGKFSRSQIMMLAVCILLPLGISLYKYWALPLDGKEIEVVVVQPNYEPHYEKFGQSHQAIASRVLELADSVLSDATDYLVLPETSFSRIDMDQLAYPDYFRVFDRLRTQYPNLKIVTGLGAYRLLSDAETIKLPTTRSISRQGQTFYVEEYNCAIQLGPDGVQEYYKSLFVPGAEFFPFRKILFFLKPIVDQLGGTLQGYRTLTKYSLFESQQAKVAPPICFESIFGEYTNQLIRRGAETIFVMTNDGWWDNTAGHRQHAQFAKLRAIETRRTIARAANMGTTGFINLRGDYTDRTKYGVAAAKKSRITLSNEITFYVRWGDVIGRISVFIAGLLLLRSLVLRFTASQ